MRHEVERQAAATCLGGLEGDVVEIGFGSGLNVPFSGGSAVAGIELAGLFGPHVLVRDNLLQDAGLGVIVEPHAGPAGPVLWSVESNVTTSGSSVVAPGSVRQSGNVP